MLSCFYSHLLSTGRPISSFKYVLNYLFSIHFELLYPIRIELLFSVLVELLFSVRVEPLWSSGCTAALQLGDGTVHLHAGGEGRGGSEFYWHGSTHCATRSVYRKHLKYSVCHLHWKASDFKHTVFHAEPRESELCQEYSYSYLRKQPFSKKIVRMVLGLFFCPWILKFVHCFGFVAP